MGQLTNGRCERFRTQLLVLRQEHEARIRRLRTAIAEEGAHHPATGNADDDVQAWCESVETLVALIAASLAVLRSVTAAQARIASGEYGVCTDCDQAITDKRLTANPLALRCRDCQEAVENEDDWAKHVPVYPYQRSRRKAATA